MTRILPLEWHYAVMTDDGARLGPDTRLVVRVEGEDHTVLAILPGPELAEKFLELLAAAPHEVLWGVASS